MHRYSCFHISTIPQKSPPHLPPLSKVRCCRPKKIRATTGGIATPPSLRSTPTLPKPHYPSPRTKLASLVKGRWIDGKTQTVALLRFTCDMPTLFMLQTLLPSRQRDCHSITPSKTALSHLLFVLQSSVCAYTVLHLNYHISLFVGRGSVCACMVLHPCKT